MYSMYSIAVFCRILFFSQRQLPHKMKSRLVMIECAGYIFWQLFVQRLFCIWCVSIDYESLRVLGHAIRSISRGTLQITWYIADHVLRCRSRGTLQITWYRTHSYLSLARFRRTDNRRIYFHYPKYMQWIT